MSLNVRSWQNDVTQPKILCTRTSKALYHGTKSWQPKNTMVRVSRDTKPLVT